MRTAAFVAGVVLWSALVFVATFYLTFPSDALVARIQKEAPNLLGPDYKVSLESASPWWIGVSMSEVVITQTPRKSRRNPEPEETLVAYAPAARVRTSLFSLLRRTPFVRGKVSMGDGTVDFDVMTKAGERRPLEVAALQMTAEALPLADVMNSPMVSSSMGGFSIAADGTVDLDIDLQSGERGMADGNGRVSLIGEGLMLSDIVSETTGPLGIDVPIDKLEFVAEVEEGKGKIDDGLIVSDLFKLEISGDFGLRDPLPNSTINFEIELSDISKDLSLVETMLKGAVGATAENGSYKFNCRGMLARLNARSCRAAGSRRSRASSRPSVRSRPLPRPSSTRRPSPRSNVDEDRERRREEIRERLRSRSAGRGGPEEEEDLDDLDDLPDDYEEEDLEELEYEDDLDYED